MYGNPCFLENGFKIPGGFTGPMLQNIDVNGHALPHWRLRRIDRFEPVVMICKDLPDHGKPGLVICSRYSPYLLLPEGG
ncbi:MAG: hypothetical protein LUQ13_04445, partial [Methanomicrobiales archaeon]|nr:hypothetical protein [Methanomicrobiales archaeon]